MPGVGVQHNNRVGVYRIGVDTGNERHVDQVHGPQVHPLVRPAGAHHVGGHAGGLHVLLHDGCWPDTHVHVGVDRDLAEAGVEVICAGCGHYRLPSFLMRTKINIAEASLLFELPCAVASRVVFCGIGRGYSKA